MDRIEKGEGKIDRIERELVRQVFRSDVKLAQKLHLLGYVNRLVEISNRAEDLSDQISLVVAERAFELQTYVVERLIERQPASGHLACRKELPHRCSLCFGAKKDRRLRVLETVTVLSTHWSLGD